VVAPIGPAGSVSIALDATSEINVFILMANDYTGVLTYDFDSAGPKNFDAPLILIGESAVSLLNISGSFPANLKVDNSDPDNAFEITILIGRKAIA